jgi:hypothetical protein
MPDTARVKPFATGTEFSSWLLDNCSRCEKASDGNGTCDLEDALFDGMIVGDVTQEQADRIGRSGTCKEIDTGGTP